MCRLWLRSCAPTRDDTPPPHPIRSTCAPRGTASRYRCSSLATAQVHSVSEEISIRDAFRVVVGVRGQLEREDVEPHLDVNRRRAERELRASEIRTSVWSSLECLLISDARRSDEIRRDQTRSESGVVSSVSWECLQYSSTIRGHQGAIRGNQEVIRGHQGAIRGDHSSAVLLVSDHLRVRAFCDQKVRPVLGAGDPARGDARCALEGNTRSESAGDHLAPLDDVRGISLVELAQSRVRLMTSGNQWQ